MFDQRVEKQIMQHRKIVHQSTGIAEHCMPRRDGTHRIIAGLIDRLSSLETAVLLVIGVCQNNSVLTTAKLCGLPGSISVGARIQSFLSRP